LVASSIGTVIADGVCEIFPPDSLPSRYGKGQRAPGCWNPRTGQFSEIVWENTRPSLDSVLSRKSKARALISNGLPSHFPDTKKEVSFSAALYREDELLQKLGINAASVRNGQLSSLVGEVFHQVGHEMARRLAETQFRKKTVTTKADETEHMASFENLWRGMAEKWSATLTAAERDKLEQLETENERDAFRIIRSYARRAQEDGAADFPIVRDNLAERLGITGNGAAGIRDKLVRLGILKKTSDYIPNKAAARFKWLLADPTAEPRLSHLSTPVCVVPPSP
jgi:hypothetical protein